MPSDPTKPLLHLTPRVERDRAPGRPGRGANPAPYARDRQTGTFSPKFDRLAQVLQRDPAGLALRADPAALAPERLLVFEVKGSIQNFAAAIRQVDGLELIDEEELKGDDEDEKPVAYLLVPDVRALREIESLWRRYLRNAIPYGFTPWKNVFDLLRDLRPWGPADRIRGPEASLLRDEVEGRPQDHPIRLEIEMVYRANAAAGNRQLDSLRAELGNRGGRVISASRLDSISYDAVLAELPVAAVRQILELDPDGIAGLEEVMHIRPQSVATSIEIEDGGAAAPIPEAQIQGTPILAILDGVPVAGHPLLAPSVVVEDLFGLEPNTPVADRVHGTAMASLVIHGDRNRIGARLTRPIHVIPVMGAGDSFPADQLIVDMIYRAVMSMRDGQNATAPNVLIVNISLGNCNRRFYGQLSAWARLLDHLAYQFGILFVVSAGNCTEAFGLPAFATHAAFEDADAPARADGTLSGLGRIFAERRLLSPAETVNGLTIGALNEDAVAAADRQRAAVNVDPYGGTLMPNPSSALGPGFALAVKPDFLMPGAREHLRTVGNDVHIDVRPAGPGRAAGLKVATPRRGAIENAEAFTSGSSAAAALASRTAHRIHDALVDAYGQTFLGLSPAQKAVLLKALLVHPARWPVPSAALIRRVIGPPDNRQWMKQRDNIRRLLGHGVVEADDAVACAADRATFWATGSLAPDRAAVIPVPVPTAMGGQSRPHSLSATLAWFTPPAPGRQLYRTVRLKVLEPSEIDDLRMKADSNQPDVNQTARGTVFSRVWSGDRAPVVGANMTIELVVQREPDSGTRIDDPIPFGLAVTLMMPGVDRVYDEVRQRLGLAARARP